MCICLYEFDYSVNMSITCFQTHFVMSFCLNPVSFKLVIISQCHNSMQRLYHQRNYCYQSLFQLNMKVKSLLDELDDIREKREASGLQSDHVCYHN